MPCHICLYIRDGMGQAKQSPTILSYLYRIVSYHFLSLNLSQSPFARLNFIPIHTRTEPEVHESSLKASQPSQMLPPLMYCQPNLRFSTWATEGGQPGARTLVAFTNSDFIYEELRRRKRCTYVCTYLPKYKDPDQTQLSSLMCNHGFCLYASKF